MIVKTITESLRAAYCTALSQRERTAVHNLAIAAAASLAADGYDATHLVSDVLNDDSFYAVTR